MKVLIATGIYPPQIGGPATYAKLLYDELPKRGIDVEVLSFGDFIDKPKIVRHFLYFLEVAKRAQHADMVYALDPVSVGLPSLFGAQVAGKKFVLRVAGDYAWEQGAQRFSVADLLDDFVKKYRDYAWQVRMLKKIQTYVAEGATRIVVPSGYLKRIVSAWGISADKIDVIYNGFHMPEATGLKTSARKKLSLKGSVIVTAGRLVPWKGIKEMIEILPEVRTAVPDATLVIVGDGPERANLENTARNLGLGDRVKFAGRLPQADLFDYVKAADVFVLNTAYEGQSHQILETMALGTPVITTAVGGNPETIEDGKTGVLLKVNDKPAFSAAIVELLRNRATARAFSTAAKKAVTQFTDEAMLENIARELKSI